MESIKLSDLMRVGGKSGEGGFVVSGPAVLAEQLPDSHPARGEAIKFVQQYEKAYGPGSRNQFAGHAYDSIIVLEKAVPIALKKAKPGTPEFRAALRDAFEQIGKTTLAHGVLNWTPTDHWGYTDETGVMLKVVNGDWKVEYNTVRRHSALGYLTPADYARHCTHEMEPDDSHRDRT